MDLQTYAKYLFDWLAHLARFSSISTFGQPQDNEGGVGVFGFADLAIF
jgi:hypothetical protein